MTHELTLFYLSKIIKKKYIALILDILSFIFEFIKCTGNIEEDIIKEQQRKTRGQEVIFRVVASFSIRQA